MAIAMPRVQQQQSTDPKDYEYVVCVAGTRYWNDRKYFHEKIVEFIETTTSDVLFVSGGAFSGADDLIIRWCQKFGYPYLVFPADWDNAAGDPNFVKNIQGFLRNERMAQACTHLLAFWDKTSAGTGDMIERCMKRGIPVQIFGIPASKIKRRYAQHE